MSVFKLNRLFISLYFMLLCSTAQIEACGGGQGNSMGTDAVGNTYMIWQQGSSLYVGITPSGSSQLTQTLLTSAAQTSGMCVSENGSIVVLFTCVDQVTLNTVLNSSMLIGGMNGTWTTTQITSSNDIVLGTPFSVALTDQGDVNVICSLYTGNTNGSYLFSTTYGAIPVWSSGLQLSQ